MTLIDLIKKAFGAYSEPVKEPAKSVEFGYPSRRVKPSWQSLVRANEQRWHSAVLQAEYPPRPDRRALYDEYKSVLMDSHLASVVDVRKAKVLEQPFNIVDGNGEINIAATRLLDTGWMRQLFAIAMDSLFYGHSLGQIVFNDDLSEVSVSQINRRHVRGDLQEVIENEWDERGVPYSGYANVFEFGDAKCLGILQEVVLPVIAKRNALNNWNGLITNFGEPIRVYKTDSTSPDQLDAIQAMLEGFPETRYLIHTRSEELVFQQPDDTDIYEVFLRLITFHNEEISKRILGATMMTDNGSSRAQAEVHERVAVSFIEKDKMIIKDMINNRLMPLLAPFIGGRFFLNWKRYQNMTLTDRADMYQTLSQIGCTFTKETISDDFGVDVESVEKSAMTIVK